jgi:ribosomal protein S18 acetylase RimI-like enzyme
LTKKRWNTVEFNVKIRELTLFDLFKVGKLSEVYFNALGSITYSISKLRILYYLLYKNNNFYIAEIGRKTVGIACAHTHPGNDVIYLDFIAIDKSYQRREIGSMLLKATLKKAVNANKKKIYFIIRADSDVRIRFYEKHGFKRVKIYYGYELDLNTTKLHTIIFWCIKCQSSLFE